MYYFNNVNINYEYHNYLFFIFLPQIHTSLVNGRPGVDGPSDLLRVGVAPCTQLGEPAHCGVP